ncbi:FAD binding domain-containing protein [Akanthomyces lecanii RCEF 1005]|uniref:FAD binding domain-containing protein n=1 Tax=Akanthomyces lecanii RCEF 1005 TaxID=1081108 RepID=A0A168I3K8_CORDF|nr:FAD binding domain-containing protein [Akanthomyces lecanii RCEF 1005]
MHVLVVGSGIAGLAAAISLRRVGHVVHVYERSALNREVGAAINVPPNASRILIGWGLDPSHHKFVESRRVTYNDPFSLETIRTIATEKTASSIGGTELYYAHRVDLHNALKWLASRDDGPGIPVIFHLDCEVVGYDFQAPSITLKDGSLICGDLVVGADGVHSTAAEFILGHVNEPVTPAYSNCCFRFLIPVEALEADPQTRFWNEARHGWTRILTHNETHRRIVAYPCRDNSVHNFVGLFRDESLKSKRREDWQASVDVSEVLERYNDFSPKLLSVISKATIVKAWPLLYRHPIPFWSKEKMTLVGDAAHPMLPHQGQAGAQGIEDGLALGLTLHSASTPCDVKKRLAIYDGIRRRRASVMQVLSNVGQDQSEILREELLKYYNEAELPLSPMSLQRHNFGYDVVGATITAMRQYDATFQVPDDFFEKRIPSLPGE